MTAYFKDRKTPEFNRKQRAWTRRQTSRATINQILIARGLDPSEWRRQNSRSK